MENFGFTNDLTKLDAVRAFRDAAVADGWSIAPTYPGTEPVERAARLARDGYAMQILTRAPPAHSNKWKVEANISIWGPDSLTIRPPAKYSFETIQAGLRTCNNCGATDVETQRYSFAGRCCADCRSAMAKQHEYPGWTK